MFLLLTIPLLSIGRNVYYKHSTPCHSQNSFRVQPLSLEKVYCISVQIRVYRSACYFSHSQATKKQYFEQVRRDALAPTSANHYCDELVSSTAVTRGKWREGLINCRKCKRNLVVYLGKFFLCHAHSFLTAGQTLYVAGSFEADTVWSVDNDNNKQPQPMYTSNAEEADTRVWIHASKTVCTRILIISADTDVYHIGLPLSCTEQKQIVVQVSQGN